MFTEAVADASEVRCAFLLGSGQPAKAKRSAHKSIYMGVFLSLFLTSIVFMAGDNIATWFTSDPALQHIIVDLIPLFGLGNVTLTVGTICWTLLGSQGRYRLATIVAILASWFVTLPLAALFTFVLEINLQGQTSAVVIGYMVSGSLNAYFLFRSDWTSLSLAVRKANESEAGPPPAWDFLASPSTKPTSPTTASPDSDNFDEILHGPELGNLETLQEAEDSFVSTGTEGYYFTGGTLARIV
jgi:MatE